MPLSIPEMRRSIGFMSILLMWEQLRGLTLLAGVSLFRIVTKLDSMDTRIRTEPLPISVLYLCRVLNPEA